MYSTTRLSLEETMRILITGGTGFVGTRLINRLLDSNHTLCLVTRNIQRVKNKFSSGIEWIEWDALQQEFPKDQLQGPLDGVINLMGENLANKRWTSAQKTKLRDSRIQSTQKLISALIKAEHRIDFFIQASAIGFYPVNQETAIDENSSKGSGFLSDLCHEWEQTLNALPDSTRKVILRIGVVLGPEAGAMNKMLFPFRLGLGGPVGNGRQMMSWIHVDDLIKIIQTAVEDTSYRGIFNSVSPVPASNREFTKALGKALKRPTLFPVPPLALRTLMGEMACLVLDGQTILPKALEQKSFSFDHPHIDEAIVHLLGKKVASG